MLNANPDLLLVLVPRHPERCQDVEREASSQGFKLSRRSDEEDIQEDTAVYLGDTIGEMALYFALGDIAFVGGSLVDTGCQNIIEPAAIGLPVITGPSLFNFSEISEILLGAGAMITVNNEEELAEVVIRLLGDKEKRKQMSDSGLAVYRQQQGVTQRNMALIEQLLQKT